jgi:glycosyltransferase involved in cell wall biosynthesis
MGYGDRYLISVVAPVYNESANIEAFYSRVTIVMQNTAYDYEIIFVNDGSKDDSMAIMTRLAYRDSKVKVIDLSRNFGKEIALSAGIDFAAGDAVIPIDVDLQDPPELIPQLIAKWQEGYDVVYATRTERAGETWLKKITAHLFYKTINKLTKIEIPADTGDFRLLGKQVVDAFKHLPERNRFNKGLFSWVGFRQTGVEYQRDSRYAGKSKYNYSKMWNYALDGITSFSQVPLQLATYFGFIVALIAFIYAIYIIVRTLFFAHEVPGYPSLITIMLFLGGVQLMTIGILGEYIGRIYSEVKERPLYLIKAKYGFSDETIVPMAKEQETADVFSSISHSFME